MAQDISGYGLRINLRASNTFPQGITLTQFADDGDPIDNPTQQITDKAMGLNGDMPYWSKANPIMATINLIPDSDDDRNMAALVAANIVGRNKRSAKDIITMTIVYPDGRTNTLNNGIIETGAVLTSVASAGRKKSKSYAFAFEGADL